MQPAPKNWPSRRDLMVRYGQSESTIRRRQRDGELVGVPDGDGQIRFDPAQLPETLNTTKVEHAPRAHGERVAVVVGLLRRGASVSDAVEQAREDFAFVQGVRRDMSASEYEFVVRAPVRRQIEAVVEKHFGAHPVASDQRVLQLVSTLAPLVGEVDALTREIKALRAQYEEAAESNELRGRLLQDEARRVTDVEERLRLVGNARDWHLERLTSTENELQDARAEIERLATKHASALERIADLEQALAEVEEGGQTGGATAPNVDVADDEGAAR